MTLTRCLPFVTVLALALGGCAAADADPADLAPEESALSTVPSRSAGAFGHGTQAHAFLRNGKLDFQATITDKLVRERHPTFDGLESVVLVFADGTRRKMPFSHSFPDRFEGQRLMHDFYSATITTVPDEILAIYEQGLRVELETNSGVITIGSLTFRGATP